MDTNSNPTKITSIVPGLKNFQLEFQISDVVSHDEGGLLCRIVDDTGIANAFFDKYTEKLQKNSVYQMTNLKSKVVNNHIQIQMSKSTAVTKEPSTLGFIDKSNDISKKFYLAKKDRDQIKTGERQYLVEEAKKPESLIPFTKEEAKEEIRLKKEFYEKTKKPKKPQEKKNDEPVLYKEKEDKEPKYVEKKQEAVKYMEKKQNKRENNKTGQKFQEKNQQKTHQKTKKYSKKKNQNQVSSSQVKYVEKEQSKNGEEINKKVENTEKQKENQVVQPQAKQQNEGKQEQRAEQAKQEKKESQKEQKEQKKEEKQEGKNEEKQEEKEKQQEKQEEKEEFDQYIPLLKVPDHVQGHVNVKVWVSTNKRNQKDEEYDCLIADTTGSLWARFSNKIQIEGGNWYEIDNLEVVKEENGFLLKETDISQAKISFEGGQTFDLKPIKK